MTTSDLKALAGWEDANSYAKGLAMGILFDMKNRISSKKLYCYGLGVESQSKIYSFVIFR